MNILRQTWLVLFTILFCNLQAQVLNVREKSEAEWSDYSQSYLNTRNGLLQNEVNDLYLAPNRVLWVATNGGLARYTGKSCHVFNSTNDSLLKENRIEGFAITSDKQVLVKIAGHDFIELREDKLALKTARNLEGISFRNHAKVADLSLFGYPVGDFFPLDSFNAYEVHPEDKSRIFFRHKDLKSELEFDLSLTLRANLFILEEQLFSFDNQGYVLRFEGVEVDTLGQIGFLKGHKDRPFKLIWSYRRPAQHILIGSSLYQISIKNEELVFKCLVNDLPPVGIQTCVSSEIEGLIFLGTLTDGVLILSRKSIHQVLNESECSINQVPYNLQAIGSDSVISTTGIIYTPDSLICTDYMFGSNYSSALTYDSVRQLLYTKIPNASFGYIDLRKKALVRLIDTLPEAPLATNIHDGTVYTFLEDIGLMKLKGDKLIPIAILPDHADIHTARKIHFSKDSMVYIAHGYGKDPLILDLKTGVYDTLKLPGEKGKTCRFIWEKDNQLWITSYGDGIYVKDEETWKRFNPPNYPQLNACHAIVQNKEDLIFSTNQGLFVFEYKEVLKFLAREQESLIGYSFGELDGLIETEFNGGVQYPFAELESNYIAFPNFKGVSFLRKDYRDRLPKFDGEVLLVASQYLNEGEFKPLLKEVPPTFSRINIELVQVYFGNGDNAPLYYRIPELGGEWSPVDLAKGISISRLPSNKKYSIELYAPTAKEENRYQRLLEFKVAPSFYQTKLFYLLVALGFSLLVTLIFVLQNYRNKIQKDRLKRQIDERTKELVSQNLALETAISDLDKSQNELKSAIEVRSRMIAIISHDLRAPLKFYSLSIETLIEQVSKSDLKLKLKALKDGLQGSYETANQILSWVQNLKFNEQEGLYPLEELVAGICEKQREYFEAHSINYNYSIIGKGSCTIPTVVFKTILNNTLGNALKFCRSKVWVAINISQTAIVMEVNDDGLGVIQIEKLRALNEGKGIKSSTGERLSRGKGIGTLIVWESAKQLGGSVNYRNTRSGFQVRIEIPFAD